MRRLLSALGWSRVDDVAEELSIEFVRLAPARKAGSQVAVAKAIDAVVGHAKGHRRKRGWGFVACTRCANAVKWRVLEHGYPADVAEALARALAVGMSRDR